MDRRVTARTKARASAARPASWAPTMGTPSGRAEVFATGRVRAFVGAIVGALGRPGVGFGVRAGNKLAALPAGLALSAGVALGIPGRLPTDRGEAPAAGAGAGGDGVAVAVGVVAVFEEFVSVAFGVVVFGVAVFFGAVTVFEVPVVLGVLVVCGAAVVGGLVGDCEPAGVGAELADWGGDEESVGVAESVGVGDPDGVGELVCVGVVVGVGEAVLVGEGDVAV